MVAPESDFIPQNPFSVEEFKATRIGLAAMQAIEEHAHEITRAADCGEAPIAVIAPKLKSEIDEGLQWRLIERVIAERLGDSYEASGYKPVDLGVLRRGRCYVRR